MNLFCTADKISGSGGGSTVVRNEAEALRSLGECEIIDRDMLGLRTDPWGYDLVVVQDLNFPDGLGGFGGILPRKKAALAHFYAGTFTQTVDWFKRNGAKVSYTAAAHDIDLSRREHEKLGIPFNYPHLTDPALWKRYVSGYLAADLVICPSTHSAECMRRYGCKNIKVIPHGVDLPKEIPPDPQMPAVGCLGSVRRPDQFVVGYLGACGAPDKGVRYLLSAWKKLNYQDDSLLILAGRDSQSEWVQHLAKTYGGGKIWLRGWMDSVSDFYKDISLYVQPSVTEGFGIEVLEAMAHGRPVLCSTGAGAADCIELGAGKTFLSADADAIADAIDGWRMAGDAVAKNESEYSLFVAEKYTWDKIRVQYQNLWKELLAC